MADVNWGRLSRALNHWTDLGYKQVDVPWRVKRMYIKSTMEDVEPAMIKHLDMFEGGKDSRCLIGSGEQAFIEMLWNRKLVGGNYVTCTPCFRDDLVDDLHQREFMKVEVISTTWPTLDNLFDLVEKARRFFLSEIGLPLHESGLRVVETSVEHPSFDIDLNGIEIGSYGIREWLGMKWIYGTGVAEPRFTKALKQAPFLPS